MKIASTAAIVLGGLALVALVVQVGLGRQIRGNGLLAFQIRPQNPRAAAEAAEAMLNLSDSREAVRLARAGIRSSPLNAKAVRVLGMARNRLEKGTGDGALLLAGQLSWRDPPTQAWILEKAIFAEEPKRAILSAEALARAGRDQVGKDLAFSLLRILATSASSREALVDALERRPIWRHDFLYNDSPMTPEQLGAMALLLGELQGSAAPPSLGEARPVIDQLVRSGKPLEARSLYQDVAPPDLVGGDAGFSRKPDDYKPGVTNTSFDWRVYDGDAGYATVERAPGTDGQALYARATSQGSERIADRTATLSPGRYRLDFRQLPGGASSLRYFTWSVRCNERPQMLLEVIGAPSSASGWQIRSASFNVPISGCESQTIQLATSGYPGVDNQEVYFDDVAVAALAN